MREDCKISTILFNFCTDPVDNKSLVHDRLCWRLHAAVRAIGSGLLTHFTHHGRTFVSSAYNRLITCVERWEGDGCCKGYDHMNGKWKFILNLVIFVFSSGNYTASDSINRNFRRLSEMN